MFLCHWCSLKSPDDSHCPSPGLKYRTYIFKSSSFFTSGILTEVVQMKCLKAAELYPLHQDLNLQFSEHKPRATNCHAVVLPVAKRHWVCRETEPGVQPPPVPMAQIMMMMTQLFCDITMRGRERTWTDRPAAGRVRRSCSVSTLRRIPRGVSKR